MPDEAYSTRAVLESEGKRMEWFPANRELEMLEAVHGAWDPAVSEDGKVVQDEKRKVDHP